MLKEDFAGPWEEILTSVPSAVIVTGGFLRRNDRPDAVSTDSAALDGARRAAERKSVDVKTCSRHGCRRDGSTGVPMSMQCLTARRSSRTSLP